MLIESVGHGKRILAQTHPISKYKKDIDRVDGMFKSVELFKFKNEDHRPLLWSYVAIRKDCKTDRLFK